MEEDGNVNLVQGGMSPYGSSSEQPTRGNSSPEIVTSSSSLLILSDPGEPMASTSSGAMGKADHGVLVVLEKSPSSRCLSLKGTPDIGDGVTSSSLEESEIRWKKIHVNVHFGYTNLRPYQMQETRRIHYSAFYLSL